MDSFAVFLEKIAENDVPRHQILSNIFIHLPMKNKEFNLFSVSCILSSGFVQQLYKLFTCNLETVAPPNLQKIILYGGSLTYGRLLRTTCRIISMSAHVTTKGRDIIMEKDANIINILFHNYVPTL